MLKDIQSSADHRGIEIQKVGINDVYMPFMIKTKEGGFESVTSRIRFTVSLPKEFKGTHMSRFVSILNKWSGQPIAETEMEKMLDEALYRLNATSAELAIGFKYFINKVAPVSGEHSVLDLDCAFVGKKSKGENFIFELGVDVPFTSLCPCSKEISDYGAHNQRSLARINVRFRDGYDCIYIEDLAELVENEASCPIFPLLKREDEKFVTEKAYNNPKFVEDELRDLVLAMRKIEGLEWFSLECENFESIHNHNAYANHEEYIE